MGVVDLIVQQERERRRLEDERAKRQKHAYEVVRSLPLDDRRSVLAMLIDAEEGVGVEPPSASKKEASPPPAPQSGKDSFVDKAEAFVLAHPEGVKTRQVSDAIGQDVSSVDTTLRIVMNKRQTIERRGRLWFPKGAPAVKKPKRDGLRELIYMVFAQEGRPLTSAEIYAGMRKLKPDVNKSSVDGEIHRMRNNKPPLLTQVGTGPHGAGIYNVTNGGAHAATAAN